MTEPSLDQSIGRASVPGGNGADHNSPEQTATQPLEFVCPRCGEDVTATFYGPCHACREALARKFLGSAPSSEGAISGQATTDGQDSDTWIDRL
ncbi:MAG: hypothetical protein M0T79_06660 [Actinomycetota bacterium]|nr:hypothetical protein [Actinomycetota bacterium]